MEHKPCRLTAILLPNGCEFGGVFSVSDLRSVMRRHLIARDRDSYLRY